MPSALTIVVVVALLVVVLIALFGLRLRSLAARVGSFECALRSGDRWHPGIAAYTRQKLVWYEVVSLSRSPRYQWERAGLTVVERSATIRDGQPVVQALCRHQGQPLVLAAKPAAFEGLVSWLEATPPGSRHGQVI
ncbi:MAG: DUF2550 family protein [Beutenbergiaceae bacterium]